MARIDSLNFGTITIDKKKYWMRDVLIFPDGTVQRRKLGRWLAHHHSYTKEDIEDLISAGTELIVVGTGLFSGVKVTDEIREYSKNTMCEIIDLPSRQAIEKINEQSNLDKKTGALIHMLC